MELRGARALLTGSTGAVGRAMCQRLVAAGAVPLLTARDPGPLELLAAEHDAEWAPADLARPDAVTGLLQRWPDVDLLISAAAVHGSGRLPTLDTQEVEDVIAVDLLATVRLVHGLIGGMTDRDRGHVVVISSLSGLVGFPGASLYSTAKFGLRGLADGLRADLRGSAVGVSTILPGFIRDEGMSTRAGMVLPRRLPTCTADEVAAAAMDAVVTRREEVVVGPAGVRALAHLGRGLPGPPRWAARRAVAMLARANA